MTTVVLLLSKFLKKMAVAVTKTYYYVHSGFRINEIIRNVINESKQKFFEELDTPSLRRTACYCYHTTAYHCCATDGFYFCVINDFISQEFIKKRKLNNKCLIINKELNDCQCVDCTKDVELHFGVTS